MIFKKKTDIPGRITWTAWADRVKNAKIRTPEIERQNSLDIYYAPRRTGKSYHAVHEITRLLAKGEKCAYNGDYVPPPWVDPRLYKHFDEMHEIAYDKRQHNFYDETQGTMHARDFSSMPDLERNFFSEMGKWQQHNVFITQVYESIDKVVRDQASRTIGISRFWRFIHCTNYVRDFVPPGQEAGWIVPGFQSWQDIKDFFCFRNWNFMNAKVWASFNTRQTFVRLEEMTKAEKRAHFKEAFERAMEEEKLFDLAPTPPR